MPVDIASSRPKSGDSGYRPFPEAGKTGQSNSLLVGTGYHESVESEPDEIWQAYIPAATQ
jgi:hypothetical protein